MQRRGEGREGGVASDVAVTVLTPRYAEFTVVEPLGLLHELLVREDPTYGYRGERGARVALTEG